MEDRGKGRFSCIRWPALLLPVAVGVSCGGGGPKSQDKPVTSVRELLGTYDVRFSSNFFTSGLTIGVVTEGRQGELELEFLAGLFNHVGLSGILQAHGTVMLEGNAGIGDVSFGINGNGTATQNGALLRVSGILITGVTDSSTVTTEFVMERSVQGTPPSISGTYSLTFDKSPSGCNCPTTARISIDATSNGMAAFSESSDIDESGNVRGTLASANGFVSPTGRVHYVTGYRDITDTRRIGGLALSGVLATGGFAGTHPFSTDSRVSTGWTAVKQ